MNLVVLQPFSIDSFKLKIQCMTEQVMGTWAGSLRSQCSRVVNSLLDISGRVIKHLRPTPMKAHYTFNWTDLSKILFTMQMVDFRAMNTLT